MERVWNYTGRGKTHVPVEVPLSATNPMWTTPQLKPSLRSENPATNHVSHCARSWTIRMSEFDSRKRKFFFASRTVPCRVESTTSLFKGNQRLRPLLCWDVAQRKLAIGYRRFGKMYLCHLKGSVCSITHSSCTGWPLRMVLTGYSETSISTNLCCVTSKKTEDVI